MKTPQFSFSSPEAKDDVVKGGTINRVGYRIPLALDAIMLLVLCLLLTSFSQLLHAQTTITYSYDAAGNRISRTIVLAPRTAPAQPEQQPVVHTEKLADILLKIYPNPTDGKVKVELNNLPEGQKTQIGIYTMSGRLITTFKDVTNTFNVDISNQPAGIYLMRIEVGQYRTEWRIIKK